MKKLLILGSLINATEVHVANHTNRGQHRPIKFVNASGIFNGDNNNPLILRPTAQHEQPHTNSNT